MSIERVAVDLTWVRHQKVGGTESCIRNLLDGFAQVMPPDLLFVLLVTKDNADSFKIYKNYSCFQLLVCNVNSCSQSKRVVWQNIKMGKLLRHLKIYKCLEPVYGKPFFGTKNIKFITTIHDLQAKHYPQYFSRRRVAWMKISWKNAVKTSDKIVAISNFVKQDIVETYHIAKDKVQVIYDAVVLDTESCADEGILDKYKIEKSKYYYTVSSMFLHKNLKTAVLVIAELKKRHSKVFYPLVISGIGGRKREELDKIIYDNNLQNDIIFTSYVSDKERNTLYKYCKAFVFSSIFEGFGMPPIEAMAMDIPILTTRRTSIEEITGGLLNYVENPMDVTEWANKLEGHLVIPSRNKTEIILRRYDCSYIAVQYMDLIKAI